MPRPGPRCPHPHHRQNNAQQNKPSWHCDLSSTGARSELSLVVFVTATPISTGTQACGLGDTPPGALHLVLLLGASVLLWMGRGGEGRGGQELSFCFFSPSLPPLPPPPLSPVSGTPCAPLGRTSMVFVLWAVSFVTCACSPPPLRCSAAREQGAVCFVHCRVPSTELGSWQALGIGLLDEGILSFIRSFILSNPHRAATAELTPQTTFIAEETAAQVIGRQGAELVQVPGPVNGRVGPGWRVAVLQRWM